MENNDFKMHAYGVTELAMIYSPELTANGALKRFRRWIDINPVLHKRKHPNLSTLFIFRIIRNFVT